MADQGRCHAQNLRQAIAVAAALTLFANPAVANPGTAFWTAATMLVLGNLVIGLVEGGIAKAFGSRWSAFLVLIVANYISAWLGWILVWNLDVFWVIFGALGGEPIRHAVPATWITLALLSVFGVLVEAPFYWVVFLKNPRPPVSRVIAAILTANIVTGIGMGVYYAANTQSSLVTELRPVDNSATPAADLVGPPPWLYYIAEDERHVRRIRLDASDDQVIRSTSNSLQGMRLVAIPDESSTIRLGMSRHWDDERPINTEMLSGPPHREFDDEWNLHTTIENVGSKASVFERDIEYGVRAAELTLGGSADLREPERQTFKASTSWDAWHGIRLSGEAAPSTLALDNALMERHFAAFGLSVLPGDVLIFELAHEANGYHAGIYIISLNSRTIAPLVKGRSPVIVYPHETGG